MSRRLSSTAIVTLFALIAAAPAVAGAACVSPAEARAMQLRQLHVQLQVASLNCRVDDPSLPGKYGAYVHRFGGALSDNAKVLKSHFAKSGGNLDRYMTVLANDESQRAHLVDGYCESHTPLFDSLHSVKPSELEHFAATTMDKPDRPICSNGVKQVKAEAPKPVKPKKTVTKG